MGQEQGQESTVTASREHRCSPAGAGAGLRDYVKSAPTFKPYISYHSSERCYIPVFAGRRSSLYFLSFRSYGILWLGAVNYAASVASEILT